MKNRAIRLCAVMVTAFALLSTTANLRAQRQETADLGSFIKELMLLRIEGKRQQLAMWFPLEFFVEAGAAEAGVTRSAARKDVAFLEPYQVIVVQCGIDQTLTGKISYSTDNEVRTRAFLKLDDGTSIRPLKNIPPLVSATMNAMKTMITSEGDAGSANMHILLFPSKDEKGKPLVDPSSRDKLTLVLKKDGGFNEAVFMWRTPFDALMSVSPCSRCSEAVSAKWVYCAYCGQKLPSLRSTSAGPRNSTASVPSSPGESTSHASSQRATKTGNVARTWTDRSGRQVEAEFIALKDGKVTIKRKSDGKTFAVPLEQLSDADQAFVRSQDATPSSTLRGISPTDQASVSISGDWERRFGQARDYRRGRKAVGGVMDLKPTGWKQDGNWIEKWDKILYTSRTFCLEDRKNTELACILVGLGRSEHMDRLMSIEPGWRRGADINRVLSVCGQPKAVLKHPEGKWAIAVFGPFGLKFNSESGAITGIMVPCKALNEFLKVLRGSEGYPSREFATDPTETEEFAGLVRQVNSENASEKQKAEAAETLGWTGDPTYVPALIQGLAAESDKVVIACCGALQKMPDKRAVDALARLIEHQDECWGTLPAMAIDAIAKTKDERAIPVIIAAMKRTGDTTNPNAPDFRQGYADYLKELTGKDFGKDAAQWESWYRESRKKQ